MMKEFECLVLEEKALAGKEQKGEDDGEGQGQHRLPSIPQVPESMWSSLMGGMADGAEEGGEEEEDEIHMALLDW